MSTTASLEAVLSDAQRIGMLGDRPIDQVIEHAHAFVEVLRDSDRRVIDLGSGAGLPGLVIAVFRDDVHVTMVDRRQKRTDFVERAVRRLGLTERCQVWCRDVAVVARELRDDAEMMQPWDVAVSRGFGPPEATVSMALSVIHSHGRIVLSEPPEHQGDRWPQEMLDRLCVDRVVSETKGVVVLTPKVIPAT
jgi:16S rRNA (guanine527-N7)-methyltransferase